MKLRTRLFLSVFLVVLVTMTVIAYGLQRAYSDSFFVYLEEEEESRMKRIIRDIGTIARSESIDLASDQLNAQLQLYARDSKINITIMDQESRIVANYRGLDNTVTSDSNIQVDQYDLLNSKKERIGSMLLTYNRSNPALSASLREFQKRSLSSTALGLSSFALVALIFSYFFSKKITDPIEALRDATNRIREHDYTIDLEDTNIEELQRLSGNVQFLARSLSEQDETRQQYAQDISHELRTPLTNMKLHIEAMKDGIIPVDDRNLSVLDANIDQLTLLVERLKKTFHDASLIASEDIQDVDVSALIARILDGFEPLIAQRHGQFERAISPDLHLDTDSRLFSQVLSNLLSNAIKAIEPEGTVRVALAREGKNLILIVADNGVGIDPQALPHIFDRFYRVDSSRNRKVGGQGLGLAITKSIVQQLGGRIEVASRVGKGTTFRVLFQVDFFHHSVQPRESIASRS